MKNKKYILFDLDGTLTDPGIGITNSFIYVLKYYGINVESRNSLYSHIGPPLVDTFKNVYGFSENKIAEAITKYREYYTDKGFYENSVYKDIPELLDALKKTGHILIVATSKPEIMANKVLEHFDLSTYFDFICGGDIDEKKCKKSDVITDALLRANVTDKSQVVMIGDRKYDILGADECGIDSVGVLYGYGDSAEMIQAGAKTIAQTVDELKKILL